MTEQKESYKNFIEDIARIWLEYLIAYSEDGVSLEEEVTDANGNEVVVLTKVPQSVLKGLQATVKIDITPKGVYDKFAQEQTIENLLVQGLFNPQRVGELRAYAEALDDDSVAPKQKILEICDKIEENQRRIAMIQSQAEVMEQRAQQFLMGDANQQATQMADIVRRLQLQKAMQKEAIKGEQEVIEAEEELPEEEKE
jgi:hypothetical protein